MIQQTHQPHEHDDSSTASDGSTVLVVSSSSTETKNEKSSAAASSRSKKPSNFDFPSKLLRMLNDANQDGTEHIFSWLPNGKGFRIHKRTEFIEFVLPKYYYRINIRSFLRQLNLYGFQRVKDKKAIDFGAYYHPCFVRDQPSLLDYMKRNGVGPTASDNRQHQVAVAASQQNKQAAVAQQAVVSLNNIDREREPEVVLSSNNKGRKYHHQVAIGGTSFIEQDVTSYFGSSTTTTTSPSSSSSSYPSVLQQGKVQSPSSFDMTMMAKATSSSPSSHQHQQHEHADAASSQFKRVLSMLLINNNNNNNNGGSSTSGSVVLEDLWNTSQSNDPNGLEQICKSNPVIQDILLQLEPTPFKE